MMKRISIYIVGICFSSLMISCSSLRVLGSKSITDTTINGAEEYCKTKWIIAATEKKEDSVDQCPSGLNAEVIIKPNLLHSLIHIVSFGIVKPEQICVKCQAPN